MDPTMDWAEAIERAAALFPATLEQRGKDIRLHADGRYDSVLTEIVLYGPNRTRDTRFLEWLGQDDVPWPGVGTSILTDRAGAYASPIGGVVDAGAKMPWLEQVGVVLGVDQIKRYVDRALKKMSEMDPQAVPAGVQDALNVTGDFFESVEKFILAYDWVIDTGHGAVYAPASGGGSPG